MARHVTVSCVTAPPLPVDRGLDLDAVVEAEISHWTERIDSVLAEEPDLVVLPEASDRPLVSALGEDRQAEYFEHRGTRVRDQLARIARENRCIIAYSAQQVDEGGAHNRTEYVSRDGNVVGAYNKNHLVIAEHDETGLAYGQELGVVDLDFGRVGTIICFDLNFDELRERHRDQGVELMVFSSEYHGGLMQNYWAYSLRCYLAASIRPPAPSAILSPLGETLAESTNYFAQVTQRINLDFAVVHLDGHWDKLAALKSRYREGVRVHDPGRLGTVLVTAEDPELTAEQIVREFELEHFDDYLARSREHRAQSVRGVL